MVDLSILSPIKSSAWSDAPVRLAKYSVRGVVIHHSATTNRAVSYPIDIQEERMESFRVLRAIRDYHTKVRKWSDIGYHFFISRGGLVIEARAGSFAALTQGRIPMGAHCPGANTTHLGICLEGNYNESDLPSKVWESLVRLLAVVARVSGIPLTDETVKLHRELRSTECPGDRVAIKRSAIVEHARRVYERFYFLSHEKLEDGHGIS